MILCLGPSDKIQIYSDTAALLDAHISAMDYDGTTATSYRKNTNLSTVVAPADLSAAPATGVTRNIKTINVRNRDVSATSNITIAHNDGTTSVELFKSALSPGQTLQYAEGVGWQIVLGAASTFPQVLPPVTILGSATPTLFFSKVISANTLLNDRTVRVSLGGTHCNNGGGNYQFQLSWGGSVQVDISTASVVNSTNIGPWDYRFTLTDVGGNKQAINGIFLLNDGNASSGNYGGVQRTASSGEFCVESLAVDPTIAQTLSVTVTLLTAGASKYIKLNNGTIELLG